ncbi:unnamed protein product [Ophioblennius macclurei]
MSSRVAVVTGGNKGIGLAIVQALCKQFQGDVYLTARDVGRGQQAVASLSSQGLKAKFLQLDINSLNSIAAAAAFFKENYGGVDVLINNAAILLRSTDPNPYSVQMDVTFKTNFFNTRDVLTHFMPTVKAGGRVVNVSSGYAYNALLQCEPALQERFRSEDIGEDELVGIMQRFVDDAKKEAPKQDEGPVKAYSLSKTGLTVLSMILARRLSKERPNDGILLNSCCPGWVRTDMTGPEATKSPEEGAVTPVYLALLPPGATEPHGKFLSEKAVRPW